MADILSQNEIDALIGNVSPEQSAEEPSTVPENEFSEAEKTLLEDISNTIFEACSSTLSTLLNKEVSTKEPSDSILTVQEIEEQNQKKVSYYKLLI